MTRRLLNLLTALSLLLCAAVMALWAATSEAEAHVVVYVPRLGRYTLYSQYGEVRAFGVPQSPVARSLRPIMRRIRNSDLCWEAYYDVRFDKAQLQHIVPVPASGTPSDDLFQLGRVRSRRPNLIQPLMEALEEPEQFAAAHALLSNFTGSGWGNGQPEQVRQSVLGHGPVPVEVDLSRAEKLDWPQVGYRLRAGSNAARLDAASQAYVRDYWHALFDVPVGSVPHWPFAAAAGALPLLRLASNLKGRWNARRCLCRQCGYDLRATPDRCPECGAAAP